MMLWWDYLVFGCKVKICKCLFERIFCCWCEKFKFFFSVDGVILDSCNLHVKRVDFDVVVLFCNFFVDFFPVNIFFSVSVSSWMMFLGRLWHSDTWWDDLKLTYIHDCCLFLMNQGNTRRLRVYFWCSKWEEWFLLSFFQRNRKGKFIWPSRVINLQENNSVYWE